MAVIRRRRAKAEFGWVIFVVGAAGTDDQADGQAGWVSF
jgi:hypothetical protein